MTNQYQSYTLSIDVRRAKIADHERIGEEIPA